MNVPLQNLHRVSKPEFFSDLEGRRIEYFNQVANNYDVHKEVTIDGSTGWLFSDPGNENRVFFRNEDVYIVECYDELERNEFYAIKKEIYGVLDVEKGKIYIQYVLGELSYILDAVNRMKLEPRLKPYQLAVKERLEDFVAYIEGSFLKKHISESPKKIPKLRWLVDSKILTTLMLDLSKGQDKPLKGTPHVRRFIDARPVDLQRFLTENFEDMHGIPLDPETIRQYLGKPINRLGPNGRIELEFR